LFLWICPFWKKFHQLTKVRVHSLLCLPSSVCTLVSGDALAFLTAAGCSLLFYRDPQRIFWIG
jgi:hypothetical protein